MRHESPALRPFRSDIEPVLLRLQSTGRCAPELSQIVEQLGSGSEALPAHAMLQAQDERIHRPRYLLSGWASRCRYLSDGRRQIFDFVLPGEGIGVCLRPHPLANTTTMALTPVRLLDASPLLAPEALERCEALHLALQVQADLDERRMLDYMVGLGRLSALERLAHLLLDLRDRLDVIGQVEGDRFPLPLTQEMLADAAGLSVVHVNRTLQELRRQNLAVVERGWVRLLDRATLISLTDYTPAMRTL